MQLPLRAATLVQVDMLVLGGRGLHALQESLLAEVRPLARIALLDPFVALHAQLLKAVPSASSPWKGPQRARFALQVATATMECSTHVQRVRTIPRLDYRERHALRHALPDTTAPLDRRILPYVPS